MQQNRAAAYYCGKEKAVKQKTDNGDVDDRFYYSYVSIGVGRFACGISFPAGYRRLFFRALCRSVSVTDAGRRLVLSYSITIYQFHRVRSL